MDKKLKIKIEGSSKVDINKIDLSAQARMFSGGADSHSIEPILTKEAFDQILKEIARPLKKDDEEKK